MTDSTTFANGTAAATPESSETGAYRAVSRRLPRVMLICHDGAELHSEGIARWIASFADLAGILVVREPGVAFWRRIRREIRRVGPFRFADVLAFRLYHRLMQAGADRRWQAHALEQLRARYPSIRPTVARTVVGSPNSANAEAFIRAAAPDVMLALCKNMLAERIFSIPRHGTFVLHPGICPEYRNAHGCFWAIARGDIDKVGTTLLRIDRGIDTGPVFGYFRSPADESGESHIVIQHRTVLDNLGAIRDLLLQIADGAARPIPTAGRPSAVYGQPWLTAYVRLRYYAWRRRRARDRARVS